MQDPQELKSISSRSVLSEITAKYQHHVTYTCKVRKHGTLVYRHNSDILALLSEALWKLKQAHVEPIRSEALDTSVSTCPDPAEACNIGHVNKLIHTQIESYLCASAKCPLDYDDLNLDEQISKLWNTMCVLTQSKSEIRGTSKVNEYQSTAHHVKKVRRFFLLCAILFCTDDRCSIPMHTLMTDLVEIQGGSSVLVRILNRLGVCSSADTLARFVQLKRTASDQHHFKQLSKDAFTLVSADNLDFMHSFARVFCGHQTSSWHGTTVQVAQPLPSLSLAENDTMAEGCIASTSADNTLCAITLGDTVSLTDTAVGAPTRRDTVSLTDTAVGAPTRGDTVSLTDTAVGDHTRGDTVFLTDTAVGALTRGDTVSLTDTAVGAPTRGDTVSLTDTAVGAPTRGDTVSLTDTAVGAPTRGDTVSLTDTAVGAPTRGDTVSLTDTAVGAPTRGDTVSLTDTAVGAPTRGDTVSLTDSAVAALTRGDTVSLTDTAVGAPTRGDTVSLTDTAVGAPTLGDTVSLTDTAVGAPTRGDTVSLTDTEVGAPTRGDTVSLTDTAVGTPTRGDTVSLTDTAVGATTRRDTVSLNVPCKRVERSSPFPSPMKTTQSPLAKMLRCQRTGTEGQGPQEKTQVPELSYHPNSHSTQLALTDFLCSVREKEVVMELQGEMNAYMIRRVAVSNSSFQHPFLNLQDYYSLTRPTHTEISQVIYLEVLDVADCKDTMLTLLHSLRSKFIEERNMRWLVLEGDAKLYEILKNLT